MKLCWTEMNLFTQTKTLISNLNVNLSIFSTNHLQIHMVTVLRHQQSSLSWNYAMYNKLTFVPVTTASNKQMQAHCSILI